MAHPDEAALLASLPADCRAPLEAGLGYVNDGRSQAPFAAALAAVDYPTVGTPRVFPLASALTAPQRAIAEILAYREVAVAPFALPATAANFRHWIDERGDDALHHRVVVDHERKRRSEPLWRAIQIRGCAVLADVPVGTAMRALALLWKDLDHVWYTHFFDTDDRGWSAFETIHPRLRSEARPWIADYADEALARAEHLSRTGGPSGRVKQPPPWWIPTPVRWIVMLGVVRAGLAIEPRWDVFFPIEGKSRRKLTLECLEAVPPERRTAAILSPLRGAGNHAYDVPVALDLLARVPSAELAAWIVANADNAAGMTKREVLAAVARVKSEATRAVHAKARAGRRELVLVYRRLLRKPGVGDLTPAQRAQVERAGKEYDGQDVALDVRLASDAEGNVTTFRKFLEVGELVGPDGKRLYDVLLYMVDAGVVFRPGTTRIVAGVVQDGVECEDGELCEAIEQALADHRRRKKTRTTTKTKPRPRSTPRGRRAP